MSTCNLQDGSTLAATQRAYHPDEVLKSDTLRVDVNYYLAHQVHPVVARLCDPIDGTDSAHIAECLGTHMVQVRALYEDVHVRALCYEYLRSHAHVHHVQASRTVRVRVRAIPS